MSATELPPTLDLQGPVRAEVFVLRRDGDEVLLTGPCGPAPWRIEATDAGHPMALAERMARRLLGEVVLLHSTSWRFEQEAVVLTFVAVVPSSAVEDMPSLPVGRVELARGGATRAPHTVGEGAVLEHALRHLAWLAGDDETVAAALGPEWRDLLGRYSPEPFRQLA